MGLEEPPEDVRSMEIDVDHDLEAIEKETTLNFGNKGDRGTFFSNIPVHIKYVLSIEESIVKGVRTKDGVLVAMKATIPKGSILLKPEARKSDAHNDMVSYGPLK